MRIAEVGAGYFPLTALPVKIFHSEFILRAVESSVIKFNLFFGFIEKGLIFLV